MCLCFTEKAHACAFGLIYWGQRRFFPKSEFDAKSMQNLAMILLKFSHGKLGIPGKLVYRLSSNFALTNKGF